MLGSNVATLWCQSGSRDQLPLPVYINVSRVVALLHYHATVASNHQILTSPILEQIKKLQRNGTVDHEISIIWVPRRTLVSNKILEDEGVLGDVNVSELPLYFLPLEDDMFSLELDGAFNDLYLVRIHISASAVLADS